MGDDIAPVQGPRYTHVLKAVEGRPWALHPPVLSFIVELVHFRADGYRLTADEIDRRLAAAQDDNGPRNGAFTEGPVAVMPVYGVLSKRLGLMAAMSGGTSYDELQSNIGALLSDESVKAIVLDIDSPGGEVDGLPEFAAFLRQARDVKPIHAQVNSLAASAAYWIAAQCTDITVTPSGEVGSIGVYTAHQDVSGAMEQDGVKVTLISAGKYKVEGNPYEPLGDEARAYVQDHVDAFYSMFLHDVAQGRGTTVDAVLTGYGEGRTMLAKEAKAAGMVDRIDPLDATVRRLQRRARGGRIAEGVDVLVGERGEERLAPAAYVPTQMPAAAAAPAKPDRAWNARIAKSIRRSRR